MSSLLRTGALEFTPRKVTEADEWERKLKDDKICKGDMNKVGINFFVAKEFIEVTEKFQADSDTYPEVDLVVTKKYMEIREAVETGDVARAIDKIKDLNPEVRKLQKLLEEGSPNLLNEKFCQELADEFNHAGVTKNCIKIEMEQVQRWFSRRMGEHVKEDDSLPTESMGLIGASGSSSGASKELTVARGTKVSNDTSDMPKDIGAKVDEDEIEFEAMSREGAWYDVVDFLAHRTNSAGQLEVLVRFEDFGADDDEWIVVIDALRERSIPLESSDCPSVAVGDQVSCFRETQNRAAYYDAHILEIQKKQHDIRGCRCRFLVKYDMNQVEEYVKIKDLCRRPEYKSVDGSADNKCEGSGSGSGSGIGNSLRGQAQG